MNCFTFLSSSSPPASKPRESWKTNPGLLLNTSSFSMLCIPRWEIWVQPRCETWSHTYLHRGLEYWPSYLMIHISSTSLALYWLVFSERLHTFFPSVLNISGRFAVLQTFWRMVVLPAFALPITRTRKRRARFRMSSDRGSSREAVGVAPTRQTEIMNIFHWKSIQPVERRNSPNASGVWLAAGCCRLEPKRIVWESEQLAWLQNLTYKPTKLVLEFVHWMYIWSGLESQAVVRREQLKLKTHAMTYQELSIDHRIMPSYITIFVIRESLSMTTRLPGTSQTGHAVNML